MSPPATEPAVQEAQRSILRDVVRTALPTAMGMATVTLTTSIATGMFEALWSRGVPSLVLLGFAGLAWVDARRGRFERALGLIISGVAVVVLIALTFNGGVRAPALDPVAIVLRLSRVHGHRVGWALVAGGQSLLRRVVEIGPDHGFAAIGIIGSPHSDFVPVIQVRGSGREELQGDHLPPSGFLGWVGGPRIVAPVFFE